MRGAIAPSGPAGEEAEAGGALEDVISANGKRSNKYEKLPSGEVGNWNNRIQSNLRQIIYSPHPSMNVLIEGLG